MHELHCGPGRRLELVTRDLAAAILPPEVVWIDLVNGDPEEIAFIERTTGLHVPSFDELSEIETSSRLYTENGALYLSTPIPSRADTGEPIVSPLGFVLSPKYLITVRFDRLIAFENFKNRPNKQINGHESGAGAFLGLMEAVVDRLADVLERVGGELDAVSHRVFRADDKISPRKRRPAREDEVLRETLRSIGRAGDLVSKIRDSLLGISRIIPYVTDIAADWFPAEVHARLKTLRKDVGSLNEYDAYLTGKVQFLLDATLGLINIEQNNIIKVLTIVSVVGVPPTLVASMYGMNFKNMPELGWSWGYPYALALIAVSAVAPLVWFKLRGWL